MGVKVASSCLNWMHSVPHSPSSSQQALASSIASPSSRRGSYCNGAGTMVYRYVHRLDRSTFVGYSSSKLYRTVSFEHRKSRGRGGMRRVCSATASFDSFSDEEFSENIQELALKFHLSNEDDEEEEKSSEYNAALNSEQDIVAEQFCETRSKFLEGPNAFESLEPPNWAESDEMILDNVERKANSLELPLSLRIIKRKKQWEEGVREASDSAYCSVKKAFSSMVFIIKELHSYTLQMREMLFFEDLQGILARVQTEIQASFVWLFQQVFSHTPTLMVSVMILLANYSVYSMANNAAIAAASPVQSFAVKTEMVCTADDQSYYGKQKSDLSNIKTSGGKVASIGGNNGCGGKYPPVGSGTGGEGSFDGTSYGPIVPDGAYTVGNPSRTGDEQSISGKLSKEQELTLWNSVVDEASKMQAALRDEALDHEIMLRFVAPINTKIESDIYEDHHKTEMLYQMGLDEDPSNPLLLTNYAQFLHLVNQDHDRAEEYFKKAVKVTPKDAEALNKYANFLWMIKKDLWAAEQSYLEAIDADPGNSYYASSYAHFLWNTGGEDTCYPI